MPYKFIFPDVGEGIHEGTIVKWLVKEGDKVKADQPLGEIETDKAVVEMPCPKTGAIGKIHVKEGGIIHVGEVMVTILLAGESAADIEKEDSKPGQREEKYTGSVVGFLEEAKEVQPIIQHQASKQAVSEIKATPAVRNLAKKLNADLAMIKGTGLGGVITASDVQTFASAKPPSEPKESSGEIKVIKKYDLYGYLERHPLQGIRKITANKMTESIYTAPQVTNMNEADVTELAELREEEKAKHEEEGINLTFMPYIVKAVQIALEKNPNLNASVEGEEIVIKKYYNIGIAIDTEEGLIVPVIKRVNQKDLKSIAQEIQKLADEARSRKINLMDLKGGSFTITNLGAIGVEFFTPILNYPETGILGVGRIMEKPAARKGKIEIRKMMPLSLTYDHRAVDGAQAARFMNDLIGLLENPEEIK